jgi:ParB family chromosome partitioning protein
MEKTQRRLGRGLESLISAPPTPRPVPDKPVSSGPPRPDAVLERGILTTRSVPIELLRPNPFQPRGAITDEQIQKLAESLRNSGMIQPISVRMRQIGTADYEIIAGERRWRAARLAGWREVPVLVREASDEQLLEMAIIENVQREDLNAIERATAYQTYCDRFELTAEVVAERLGEDRSTVTNYIRLLSLPADVKEMVAGGRLTMGHARCLLGIAESPERSRLAQVAVSRELSVRALEELVRSNRPDTTAPPPAALIRKPKSHNIRDLEERFERAVGTKVMVIEGRKKGSGRIVIEFYSLDDFDRIAAKLGMEAA